MPRKDRGPSFGAYYTTNPATPQHLLGARFLNAWPCGTYTINGVTKGITFFHFLKELDVEGAVDDPQHAETFDVNMTCGDNYKDNPVMGGLLMGADVTTAIKALKPVPKGLVDKDLKDGKKGEEIIETRAGILVGEFLGFTLAEVILDFPEVWQPTVDAETGQEIPNIQRCSLEEFV